MNTESPQLARFRQLVLDLNVQWQMFDELFRPQGNYAIFIKAGSSFWAHLYSYLIESIFISISRFFDPASTSSQPNLSIARIIDLPECSGIRLDLENRLSDMRTIWKKGISTWRHKRLSHSDLHFSLGEARLPDIPISEVRELVSHISDFMQEIDHQLSHRDSSFHVGVSNWVQEVLQYLEAGIRTIDAKRGKG